MSGKILIVEDESINRIILNEILSADYEILEAKNGQEGMDLLCAEYKTISVVLLDIEMPGMNGLEFLQKRQESKTLQEIPVIVVTVSSDETTRLQTLALGASDFITKPYQPALLRHCIANNIAQHEKTSTLFRMQFDPLTGVYKQEPFFKEAALKIKGQKPGYYLLSCFNIDHFKIINEQYGTDIGDKVLRHVAVCLNRCATDLNGLCCRVSADDFALLLPAAEADGAKLAQSHAEVILPACLNRKIRIRIGRCPVDDLSLPVSEFYHRAKLAAASIKENPETFIATYAPAMQKKLLMEREITNTMDYALEQGQFEPWFQPQYNHATGAMIGAEALIRWRRDGVYISPSEFIPVFERNGFIYEVDQYIWEAVCKLLRKWLDNGQEPLPVSINISRRDFFYADFIPTLLALLRKYQLPLDLLRLEVTESAFAESSAQIIQKINSLIALGFTVEIDDFGSGYSSLNTLKDVPAAILKLDMKFFENTGNSQRSGNIIESVVRMAKWLGMAVIAEGVEERAQADYLKSIGCFYIQGYLYAKAMPPAEYEALLSRSGKEHRLSRLETLETLDNNAFWDPKSMDTLIFNSYVGGACIFEYQNGKAELLRVNEQYARELGSLKPESARLTELDPFRFLDHKNLTRLSCRIQRAIKTQKEADCELRLTDQSNRKTEFVHVTLRLIARTKERFLFYCVVINKTKQHLAKQKEHELTTQLQTIMGNIRGGITATVFHSKERIEVIFSNDGFYEMYGYTKEEMEAEKPDILDLIYPPDREKTLETVARIVRERGSETYEYRCYKKDGSLIWIQACNSVIFMEGVNETVLLAVTSDVTRLHEAEEQTRKTSAELSSVLNSVDCGITAVALRGEQTEFLFANDRYFEIHGKTKENYAHTLLADSLSLVHPEDRKRIGQTVKEINQVGQHKTVVYRIIKPDGTTAWIKAALALLSLDGTDAPVQITVFTDITKEQEANARLAFLNETAHKILAQPDTDKAIEETLQTLLVHFGGDRACLMENDPEHHQTSNTYECCAPGIESRKAERQKLPLHISTAQIVRLGKTAVPTAEEAQLRLLLTQNGLQAAVLLPLLRDGVPIGCVAVDNPKKALDAVDHLEALGDYFAVLLTRRDLMRKVESDRDAIRLLVNDTPGGFCRVAVSKTASPAIVSLNEGFCKMLEMTQEAVFAAYEKDAFRCLIEEDHASVTENARIALRSNGQFTVRCRLRREKGAPLWVMIFGRFVRNGTGQLFLNTYFTDITEQHQKEDLQKNLLDNLPCGAALFEFNGRKLSVIHINRRYWALVGRQPSVDSTASVLDKIHPSDRLIVRQEVDAAIRQNRNIMVDFRIRYGENGYRPFHVVANVVAGAGGSHLLYTSYTPISEQTMSVQELLPVALSTMLSSSADFSYIKDRDLHYLCCSDSVARLLGLNNPREIIGKTDDALFDPATTTAFAASDRAILTAGKPVIDQLEKVPSASGGFRIISTSKYPIRDAKGSTIGLYGISHDVTTQKEHESQLRLLTDNIPGGLASYSVTGEQFSLVYCNDGFCALFGCTRAELKDRGNQAPLGFILEEDRQLPLTQFARLVKNGTQMDCVYRIRTKDGLLRWISHKATVTGASGGVLLVNAVLLDVTKQQEEKEQLRLREEEYRLATQHSKRTICRYDIAAETLRITAEAASRLSLPEVLTEVPEGLVKTGKISPETAAAYTAFYKSIQSGKAEASVVFQKLLPAGWRWIDAHATTIYADNGTPVSAIISYVDVTEQQEKEAVYRKWQQALAARPTGSYTLYRCNLSKDGLYDTKEGTLLNFEATKTDGISTFDDQLERFVTRYVYEEDQAAYRKFLHADTLLAGYYRGKRTGTLEFRCKLSENKVHWLRLTVELMEFPNSTEVEAYLMYEDINDQKLERLETIQLAETDPLTGLLNRKAFAGKVDAAIKTFGANTVGAVFLMDLDGFKLINDSFGHAVGDQVLRDIGQSIRSVLRSDDLVCRLGGDEFLVFLPAMPDRAAILEKARLLCMLTHKVFNPNIRVSISLGIAVCPEDGTTFEALYEKSDKALYHVKKHGRDNCAFYQAALEQPDTEDSENTVSSLFSPVTVSKKHRMLIVDDENVNRRLLENIFRDSFEITTAGSGREALVYLRRYGKDISIVLLDLAMPEMDGFAVLEKMQNSMVMQSIPVIVVTGMDDRESNLRAIHMGASDYVTKPVDRDLLWIRVLSALSKAENERLRAQNHFLSLQKHEMNKIRSVIDAESTAIAEYSPASGGFKYDPAMARYIAGRFDSRTLWEILAQDGIASRQDISKLQKLVSALSDQKEKSTGRVTVRLRTPSGRIASFRVKALKSKSDWQTGDKLLLAFTDLCDQN